jgi:hypothetical protein
MAECTHILLRHYANPRTINLICYGTVCVWLTDLVPFTPIPFTRFSSFLQLYNQYLLTFNIPTIDVLSTTRVLGGHSIQLISRINMVRFTPAVVRFTPALVRFTPWSVLPHPTLPYSLSISQKANYHLTPTLYLSPNTAELNALFGIIGTIACDPLSAGQAQYPDVSQTTQSAATGVRKQAWVCRTAFSCNG